MKGGIVFLCLALCSLQIRSQEFTNASELLPPISLNNTFYGCGISLYDVNKDGLDDLTIGGKTSPLRLFLNSGDSFELQNLGLFFNEEVKGVLWADYDNDGDADLFVSRMFAPVKLYRNDGGLQLVDVTAESGILQETGNHWGAAWGDVNNDSFLDLYLCKYNNPTSFPNTYPFWNRLYLNNTDGTFSEIAVEAGVADGVNFSFLASFIDFDQDGWQDIYVINDKTSPNSLYRNNGDLSFTEVGAVNGAGIVIDAMSCTPGDYDQDGDDDIYITNTDNGNALLRADYTGFENVAEELGVAIFHDSWGANFLDADNDGDLDLFVATQAGPEQLPNQYFRNENGVFVADEEVFGGTDLATTFASAICDLNHDGALDIVNHNAAPDQLGIWLNSNSDNHYLRMGLNGVLSNRDGIGTKIEIWHCGSYQSLYTHCGESYLAQNSRYEHFGLGQCGQIDSLQLTWLSGVNEKYYALPVDTLLQILEGQSFQLLLSQADTVYLCPSDSIVLCASGFPQISWNSAIQSCITAFPGQSYVVSAEAHGEWYATDTITVLAFEPIQPQFTLAMPSCAGHSDGSIALVSDSLNYQMILWDNGTSGALNESLMAGWYSYSLVDTNGCSYADSLELTEPFPLELSLELTQESPDQLSEALFFANGGTPPYLLSWGEFDTWQTIDLPPGEYMATLSDALGCTDTLSFEVFEYTSVHEFGTTNGIQLRNPMRGTILIPNSMQWQLLDAGGRVIRSSESMDGHRIDPSGLAPGIYFLLLQQADQRVVHRLLKE